MYIYIIQVYRCARRCRAIDTRMYFYIHAYAHARGYGCRQTRTVPRMRVCASGHPHTPRGTSAHASRHTLAWNLHVHTYAHACAHTYTYTHGGTHLAVARPRCAAARAHTHTHSCTSACAHARWNARYERTHASAHARICRYRCT